MHFKQPFHNAFNSMLFVCLLSLLILLRTRFYFFLRFVYRLWYSKYSKKFAKYVKTDYSKESYGIVADGKSR